MRGLFSLPEAFFREAALNLLQGGKESYGFKGALR